MTGTSVETTKVPETVAEALHVALAEHRAGRRAEAQAWYRRILTIEPDQPDALHLLGLLTLDAGSSGAAEVLVHRAVHLDIRAVLYRVNLGIIRSNRADAEGAAICFELALNIDPRNEGAARGLGEARVRLAVAPDAVARSRRRWRTADAAVYHPEDARRRAETGPGHLLIRGWGCGFWGEVNHVAVQLALADIMGREPVVYWGSEFRYRAPGIENAWEGYFEPVSATDIAALERQDGPFFPGQWTGATLRTSHVRPMHEPAQTNPHGMNALAGINRGDAVVVADGYAEMSDVLAWAAPGHPLSAMTPEGAFRRIFTEKIRPNFKISDRIDQSTYELLKKNPTLAVHYRAQHKFKKMESLENNTLSLDEYYFHIDKYLNTHPNGYVFLLTDLTPAIELFRSRLGKKVIVLPRHRLSNAEQIDIGLDHTQDGHQLALEVLEDAYLAAACDFFLGDGASGVSCAIAALKDWPEGHARLLRRHVFNERRGATAQR